MDALVWAYYFLLVKQNEVFVSDESLW
jgi:hypothetical protein